MRKQITSARLQKAAGAKHNSERSLDQSVRIVECKRENADRSVQTAEVRREKKQKAESRSMSVATRRHIEQPDFRRQSAGAEGRRQQ